MQWWEEGREEPSRLQKVLVPSQNNYNFFLIFNRFQWHSQVSSLQDFGFSVPIICTSGKSWMYFHDTVHLQWFVWQNLWLCPLVHWQYWSLEVSTSKSYLYKMILCTNAHMRVMFNKENGGLVKGETKKERKVGDNIGWWRKITEPKAWRPWMSQGNSLPSFL